MTYMQNTLRNSLMFHTFSDTPSGGALTVTLPSNKRVHYVVTRIDLVGGDGSGTPTLTIETGSGNDLVHKSTGMANASEGEKDFGGGIAFPHEDEVNVILTRTSLTTGRLSVTFLKQRE